MRPAVSSLVLFAGLFAIPAVQAQSTISDSPLELTTSVGLWAALLPDGKSHHRRIGIFDNCLVDGCTGALCRVRLDVRMGPACINT